MNELLARVRALLRRGRAASPPIVSYGGLTFDTVGPHRRRRAAGRCRCRVHETGVLEVLLHRFGRVVSKEQLVEQLYSYDKEVSQNAIEVYVHRAAQEDRRRRRHGAHAVRPRLPARLRQPR